MTLRLAFTDEGWNDYQYWLANDTAVLRRINTLITAARRTPDAGIGKPEQLRYVFESPWSRRITQEHRLVYSVDDEQLTVWQCRFHY